MNILEKRYNGTIDSIKTAQEMKKRIKKLMTKDEKLVRLLEYVQWAGWTQGWFSIEKKYVKLELHRYYRPGDKRYQEMPQEENEDFVYECARAFNFGLEQEVDYNNYLIWKSTPIKTDTTTLHLRFTVGKEIPASYKRIEEYVESRIDVKYVCGMR